MQVDHLHTRRSPLKIFRNSRKANHSIGDSHFRSLNLSINLEHYLYHYTAIEQKIQKIPRVFNNKAKENKRKKKKSHTFHSKYCWNYQNFRHYSWKKVDTTFRNCNVPNGVPQGIVFSSILFNLHQQYPSTSLQNTQTVSYVDNITLIHSPLSGHNGTTIPVLPKLT